MDVKDVLCLQQIYPPIFYPLMSFANKFIEKDWDWSLILIDLEQGGGIKGKDRKSKIH